MSGHGANFQITARPQNQIVKPALQCKTPFQVTIIRLLLGASHTITPGADNIHKTNVRPSRDQMSCNDREPAGASGVARYSSSRSSGGPARARHVPGTAGRSGPRRPFEGPNGRSRISGARATKRIVNSIYCGCGCGRRTSRTGERSAGLRRWHERCLGRCERRAEGTSLDSRSADRRSQRMNSRRSS